MALRRFLLSVTVAMLPTLAFGAINVVENAEAEKLYAAEKEKAPILVQKNREFTLREKGKETLKPETITIKVGQYLYITNEEHSFVHNVYDESDSSWVLKKQEPSKVAAIRFDKPGTHKLRCAIHPTMKTTLNVVP